MKDLIESIRKRFGDPAAYVAEVYVTCKELVRHTNQPILTKALVMAAVRYTQITPVIFATIVRESDELDNRETTIH